MTVFFQTLQTAHTKLGTVLPIINKNRTFLQVGFKQSECTVFGMGNGMTVILTFIAIITSVSHIIYAILYHKLLVFLNMLNLLFQNPLEFVIVAFLLILAITVHEFSHAFFSDKLGDPTARLAGRLTLNPLAHLDPVGSILLLLAGFGWGKPVPVDPFNLRDPKRDNALISFAGPMSNLLIAGVFSIFIRLIGDLPSLQLSVLLTEALSMFIYFNVLLAVFNLIPIHPLDGFSVVAGFMPKKYYSDWLSLSSYGMIFLIFLIFPFFGNSPISAIISPIVNLILSVLLPTHSSGII